MKKFLILLCIAISTFGISFASERVFIFIDISGSMDKTLHETKSYICSTLLDEKSENTYYIYKFYGKLKQPAIFEGTLKKKQDKNFVISQINSLAANGPWTNLENVFEFVNTNCNQQNDTCYIFTDGNHELENYTNVYQVTNENIATLFNENAVIKTNGNIKYIEYKHKIKPVAKENKKNDKPVNTTKQSKSSKPKVKKSFNFNFGKIFAILGIILLVILIILILTGTLLFILAYIAENKNNENKKKKYGNRTLRDEERARLNNPNKADAENKKEILNVISERMNLKENLNNITDGKKWKKEKFKIVDFLMILRHSKDEKSISILNDGGKSQFPALFQNWYAREGGKHEFIGTQSWWRLLDNKKLKDTDCRILLNLIPLWTLDTSKVQFKDGYFHPKGTSDDLSPMSTEYHNSIKKEVDKATNARECIKNIKKINKKYLSKESNKLADLSLKQALHQLKNSSE